MKMPTESIENIMFAPCGINCMVCYKHCYNKKPCDGCFKSNLGKPEHCRKCKIKDCVIAKGLYYCYECAEYPCKQIKSLEKSYNTRYNSSLIANSRFVKENGFDVFMAKQKELFVCPDCGGIISMHDSQCSECQRQIKQI